eukprot:EC825003.1.p1 GENE.EC825003.1~~EC825003.1.p1  ORF type:complete len:128 (+),score=31.35 EC825003.1:23-406(+)
MVVGFLISKSISNILGVVYPSYKSFKALQTKAEEDDTQWLTYWCCFSFILMIECYFDWFLRYLPLYFEIKIILLIWLMFPIKILNFEIQGASFIYNCYVSPFLSLREGIIDKIFSDIGLDLQTEADK